MAMFATSPAPPHLQHPESPHQSFAESDHTLSLPEDPWSDLKKVLADVGRNLSANQELDDLAAAEAAVNAKDVERAEETGKLEVELRQLQKQFDKAQASAQRPPTVPSEQQHAAHMHDLQEQECAVGKSLREEQETMAKREAELSRWKVEREVVRDEKVGEGIEEGFNAKALRLQLLDGCGFRYLQSDGASKIIVRNEAKNDVNALTLDKGRSKVYWANLMWSLAGE